jgi:diacylglycerol kinase
MTKSTKAGWIGAGLLVTGAGLTMIGAALVTPVCVMWSTRVAKKLAATGTERMVHGVETASTALGTQAGRLQRQFRQAARAASDIASAARKANLSSSPTDTKAS